MKFLKNRGLRVFSLFMLVASILIPSVNVSAAQYSQPANTKATNEQSQVQKMAANTANTDTNSIYQKMAADLIKSVSKNAKSIGTPQFIEINTNGTTNEKMGAVTPDSTLDLITNDNPLMQSLTFTVGYWGAYHEFDGNHVAVAYNFTCPAGWNPAYYMQIGLFEWGQQYVTKEYVLGYNENQTYSFASSEIIPRTQSYRLRYESNTTQPINVFIVALPYYA